jgi:hypothetical protein
LNKIVARPPEIELTCNKVLIQNDSLIGLSSSGKVVFEFSILKKQVNQNRYDQWIHEYENYQALVHHRYMIINQMTSIITTERRKFHQMN